MHLTAGHQEGATHPSYENGSESSPWAWLPLGFVLALSVQQPLTRSFDWWFEDGRYFAWWFEPERYLVIFAPFLAVRFGPRCRGPLLLLSLLALFSVSFSPLEYIWVRFGYTKESSLLALCAALAFAGNAEPIGAEQVRRWWRPALGAAAIVLTIGAYARAVYEWQLDETINVSWDVGASLAAVVLLGAAGWRRTLGRLPLVLAGLVMGALLITFEYRSEGLVVQFGYWRAMPVLIVLCFALPAMNVFRWSSWLTVLIACYIAGLAIASIGGPPEPASQEAVLGLTEPSFGVRNWSLLVDSVSAVLLGMLIAPFWQGQPVDRLRNVQTPIVLGGVLALQFVGLAPTGTSEFHAFVLGGVAFITGLVWRGKGVVAAPIVIQLCSMLQAAAGNSSLLDFMPSIVVRLGMVTFPFAFFGMLVNRHHAKVSA